ncbi:hypothetical protein [Agromyces sp. CCNWLW203]|uniref:hypothetical protein n=1 Tax=Agromyces sp. CCNWLW203 TaxID=3112842 RepID=UPI002F9696C3
MSNEVDVDGFPPAPTCSTCGAVLEPEPIASAIRVVVAYACPVHGVDSVLDPFGDSPVT